MAVMTDLDVRAARLRAALDERERTVRAATAGPWHQDRMYVRHLPAEFWQDALPADAALVALLRNEAEGRIIDDRAILDATLRILGRHRGFGVRNVCVECWRGTVHPCPDATDALAALDRLENRYPKDGR